MRQLSNLAKTSSAALAALMLLAACTNDDSQAQPSSSSGEREPAANTTTPAADLTILGAAHLSEGGVAGAKEAASALLALGPRSAVVTVGASGAVFASADGNSSGYFPAPKVEVVDTTGAGDTFVGSLAARLASGDSLPDAVAYAVRAGAVAVTKEGAQGGCPTPEEVESL